MAIPRKSLYVFCSVEIINVHEQTMASASNDTMGEVHPSNMEVNPLYYIPVYAWQCPVYKLPMHYYC